MLKTQKSANRFSQRRASILDVFNKTKTELSLLVKEQESYVSEKIEERDRIDAEVKSTQDSIADSLRLVGKIDEFLA